MILLKLGGSVITDKSRPLAASGSKIAAMARAVATIREPVIIVHGGGSFGHYWSVKYDMHSAAGRYDTAGVSEVKNSMVHLNMIILEKLRKAKLKPYVVAPSAFMSDTTASPSKSRIITIGSLAEGSDMTPVTYGDALYCKGEGSGGPWTYILSGDRIMSHMARILRPRLCIFALGEDGLYTDIESGRLIPRVHAKMMKDLVSEQAAGTGMAAVRKGVMDVTGGMVRKVAESARITSYGIPVAFVNGNHPKRIRDAASAAGRFKGTYFEAADQKRKNRQSVRTKM